MLSENDRIVRLLASCTSITQPRPVRAVSTIWLQRASVACFHRVASIGQTSRTPRIGLEPSKEESLSQWTVPMDWRTAGSIR